MLIYIWLYYTTDAVKTGAPADGSNTFRNSKEFRICVGLILSIKILALKKFIVQIYAMYIQQCNSDKVFDASKFCMEKLFRILFLLNNGCCINYRKDANIVKTTSTYVLNLIRPTWPFIFRYHPVICNN